MLHMNKIRIQAIIIIALLFVSVAAQAQREISPRQKEQLKSALIDMKHKTERERDALRKSRMDLFLAYQKYDMDERKIKMLQAQISESQLNLLNIHLDNQLELRDILNESQFTEFQRLMRQEIGGNPGMIVMPPPEDAIHDKFPDANMVDDLKLTTDQRRKIQPLIGPGAGKTKLFEKVRKNAKQMIEEFSKYNLDTAEVKKLIASIHQDQEDLASLNFKRQQALRQVLNEDQFSRLMTMITEKFREHTRHGRRR